MGQTQFRSDDTVKWWLGFGNGSDGDYSSSGNATDAPTDSACSGTSGSYSLTATNASFAAGKPVLIHQTRGTGAGTWELNQILSYVAGTITLMRPLQNTYTNSGASVAQVIQLKQYNTFTQNSGHTLTAKAWNGTVGGIVAFLSKLTTTITGTINANGLVGGNPSGGAGIGFIGGTGIKNSTTAANQGESSTGAGSASTSANGTGGGGGKANGADGGSGGGGGGHATSGTDGVVSATAPTGTAGTGGGTAGNASLTTMLFGGSGGGAANGFNEGTGVMGGSSGGGIVLIITPNITITGSVSVNGGGTSGNPYTRKGGGGAGGSCLIKTKVATLGSSLITLSGGLGGTGDAAGGTGGVGRVHIDYSGSYTGSTTPTLDARQDSTITSLGTIGGEI